MPVRAAKRARYPVMTTADRCGRDTGGGAPAGSR
jgi:hypothetical protein